jgi:hypothetical protein
MKRSDYISGVKAAKSLIKFEPGQIWQMKQVSVEKFQLVRQSFDYHILIAKVDKNDNIVSHLVHEITQESLDNEIMWAAANWKRDVLARGERYSFPGVHSITVRLFHRDYIIEHYALHDRADYLLANLQ